MEIIYHDLENFVKDSGKTKIWHFSRFYLRYKLFGSLKNLSNIFDSISSD